MSKKVFMLSTSTCGYCRQSKSLIEAKYPDLTGDQFTYFEMDSDTIADEASMVLGAARSLGVRGVPFTVLIEDGQVTKAVRGYNPSGLEQLVEEVLGKSPSEEPAE